MPGSEVYVKRLMRVAQIQSRGGSDIDVWLEPDEPAPTDRGMVLVGASLVFRGVEAPRHHQRMEVRVDVR